MTFALASPARLAVAFIAALALAGAARKVRALSVSGMIAATVVGTLLFGCAGWPGAAALLLFFVTSSALSRWGRKRKAALSFEKGGERDAGQVLANGGVAALCAALLPFFPASPWLFAALLGALAEANADTWATEIGSLAAAPPRLITNFRPAPTGSSGAVSLPGTAAALAGAALIAGVAWVFGMPARIAIGALLGGFAGALFDSLIGATLQAQYRCMGCGRLTESRTHCGGQPAALAQGIAWVGNDAVNFLATIFGAAVAGLMAWT
jgi:uncharacterized protein (TIGR00297 family)